MQDKEIKGDLSKEPLMGMDAPMYIYATEMVSEYYKALAILGLDILTITGSGDQVLNALSLGAKTAMGFDINQNAGFITQLKGAMIRGLPRQDFFDFFGNDQQSGDLSYAKYNSIRNSLPEQTQEYFDKLYGHFHNNGEQLRASKLFRQRGSLPQRSTRDINHYLEDDVTYLDLREKLTHQEIELIQGSLFDIPKLLVTRKFDVINLSNVPNYLLTRDTPEEMGGFVNTLKALQANLNKGGRIVSYSYSPTSYPNAIAQQMPYASEIPALQNIASQSGMRLEMIEIPGISPQASDRINVFSLNLLH